MAIKTFTTGEVLTASDTNTYLANSGLVYVTSATVGSGVSSVTVSNCFSSTYDNYRIIWTGGTTSAGQDIRLQLGSTTTGYYNSLIYGTTYASPGPAGVGTNNGSNWNYLGWGETSYCIVEADIYQPYLSKYTGFRSAFMALSNAGQNSGTQQSNTSFTGFTLSSGTSTMTGGTVTVYGYRKA